MSDGDIVSIEDDDDDDNYFESDVEYDGFDLSGLWKLNKTIFGDEHTFR